MTETVSPRPVAEPATDPVLLDSRAARSCPVKTQNAFLPRSSTIRHGSDPETSDPAAQNRREAAAERRRRILDDWLRRVPGAVDLRDTDVGAVDAARAGAALIIGGSLPVDPVGHRVGTPDALVRGRDSRDGRPGYHPVVVKGHRIITADPPVGSADDAPRILRYGTLATPTPDAELPGFRLKTGSRLADFLQLAHYHRLLTAAGLDAPGPVWGGVIGTDPAPAGIAVNAGEPLIGWQDLGATLPSFDRPDPDLRSFLQRYDDEHCFRLAIAESARGQTGRPELDPPLLVGPIVNAECAGCPWWSQCRPQLDDDDLGLRIERGRLRPREMLVLRELGRDTVAALAAADLDALLPTYLDRLGERPGAETRLRTAARRARMLTAGVEFAREGDGPIEVPAAEIEIDFDLETAADGRVYLWGFWVSAGGGRPYCRQFFRFDDLDAEGELALAREALGWLRGLVEGPAATHVYHYSGFEVAMLRQLAERSDDPLLQWAADYAGRQFVDLLEVAKTNYFGVSGLGLKAIARHAGFAWRDPDPGGLNSQLWFAQAVHGPPDQRPLARRRVLEYNEDDVIATCRLRAWLRAQ